jgi:hypothetical protein
LYIPPITFVITSTASHNEVQHCPPRDQLRCHCHCTGCLHPNGIGHPSLRRKYSAITSKVTTDSPNSKLASFLQALSWDALQPTSHANAPSQPRSKAKLRTASSPDAVTFKQLWPFNHLPTHSALAFLRTQFLRHLRQLLLKQLQHHLLLLGRQLLPHRPRKLLLLLPALKKPQPRLRPAPERPLLRLLLLLLQGRHLQLAIPPLQHLLPSLLLVVLKECSAPLWVLRLWSLRSLVH